MRTIGLIGGLSWVSAEHYHRLINEAVQARLGGNHCARLVTWSEDFEMIATMQREGRWHESGGVLARGARVLVAAGADVVAIGANTMHLVADQVAAAAAPVPLLHIVDVVRAAAVESGVTCVGLLGTAYTMESTTLYPPRLAQAGIEVIVPDDEQRAEIQRITYDELTRGIVSDQARSMFRAIAAELVARGADAIVLGCTEHGLLLRARDLDVAVLDSTILHADALVRFALDDADESCSPRREVEV